jgi:hypothetical protein
MKIFPPEEEGKERNIPSSVRTISLANCEAMDNRHKATPKKTAWHTPGGFSGLGDHGTTQAQKRG